MRQSDSKEVLADVKPVLESESSLEHLEKTVASRMSSSELHSLDHLRIGEILLGKYRIDEIVGEGGFGIVYKATDPDGNIVAVKTLRRTINDYETAQERFRREVALTLRLKNPHTIKTLDYGTSDNGILFFVMEFLSGHTLADVIAKQEKYDFNTIVEILLQVCQSLEEAHNQNIVHRDLKPSNLFISKSDDIFVKVLDFGIAKVSQDWADDNGFSDKLTKTGVCFGSPSYMSPEQVVSKNITAASDIYSLGIIALEALTSEDAVKGNSAIDIVMKQMSVIPVHIPDWIAESDLGPILKKALDKNVHKRYRNAPEMLADLRELSRDELTKQYENARSKGFYDSQNESEAELAFSQQNNKQNRIPIVALAIFLFSIVVALSVFLVITAQNKKNARQAATSPVVAQRTPTAQTLPDPVEEENKRLARSVTEALTASSSANTLVGLNAYKKIEIIIDVMPEGCSLFSMPDGEFLGKSAGKSHGQSPLVIRKPRGPGKLLLKISKNNYVEQKIEFNLMLEGNSFQGRLEPVKRTPPPPKKDYLLPE